MLWSSGGHKVKPKRTKRQSNANHITKTNSTKVKKAQKAKGFEELNTNSALIDEVLEGHKKLKNPQPLDPSQSRKRQKGRLPCTLNTLRWLKTKIKLSNLSPSEKVLMWGACSIGFFGSLRLGELLSKLETEFDPNTSLLKKDFVIVKGDKIDDRRALHLRIRSSKTNKTGKPETVIVYETNDACCPVKAAEKILHLNRNLSQDKPIFSLGNLKLLTQNKFNFHLKVLTEGSAYHGRLSGHSFRAGIPSILGKLGYSDEKLKKVGRWSSRAFTFYTKLGRTNRQQVAKLCSDVDKLKID